MATLRSDAAARREARRAYNLALPKHQIDLVALRRVWALPPRFDVYNRCPCKFDSLRKLFL